MKIENLIIHCSDSSFGDVETIRGWHKQQGWKDIGYNAVILNGRRTSKTYKPEDDGLIEVGRGLDFDTVISPNEVGAHTLGYNSNSIGVCLIGIKDFTDKQWKSLEDFCRTWTNIVPGINIIGHRDADTKGKTCPNFDVKSWWEQVQRLDIINRGK